MNFPLNIKKIFLIMVTQSNGATMRPLLDFSFICSSVVVVDDL